MNRPQILGRGFRGLFNPSRSRRGFVSDADIEGARKYCLNQLRYAALGAIAVAYG